MKSDEKVIEEFREFLKDYEISIVDRHPNSDPDELVYDFILETRREAVEEAFKAIKIEKRKKIEWNEYSNIVKGSTPDDCNNISEGFNQAIDEINRKKEEFLMEK